jgi:LacI family transcriptional regulator
LESTLSGAPPRIALVCDVYYESMHSGVAAYLGAAGYDLASSVFRNPGVLPKHEKWAGVIAWVWRDQSVEWLAQTNAPIVHILSPGPFSGQAPLVICDWQGAGRCGARHLLELGNVNFAFYRAHTVSDAVMMQDGFNSEIERAGYPVRNFNFPPHGTGQGPLTATTRAERLRWLFHELKGAKFPLAVMAEDDRYAVDLVFAARVLGLRVPEDIAILGAEDDRMTLDAVPIKLSSVDVNLRAVGWRAAELLDRMIKGAKPGSEPVPLLTCVPPNGVVVRQSTTTFVCRNPAVTAAAMFVRKNFRESISATQVAAAAGISLRRLQEEYPDYVGRSIKEDILFQRLRAVEQLLERTDLKLAAIAWETGLGSLEHLCKVFRRERGITPHEWRKKRAMVVT